MSKSDKKQTKKNTPAEAGKPNEAPVIVAESAPTPNPQSSEPQPAVTTSAETRSNPLVRTVRWSRHHKRISLPLLLLLVLIILTAIPYSRYTLAGMVWKQNYTVAVVDQQTNRPISSALVSIGGQQKSTNEHGQVTLHVRTGYATLAVSKKYYRTFSKKELVPLRAKAAVHITLKATGRLVSIHVTDKISGKPLKSATISAADTKATTDAKGDAVIVLPAGKATVSGTITANSYNKLSATIQINNQTASKNDFQLTPAGKVYFLSNLSGNLDIVKTNLDGSDRQTVLAGTSQEDPQNTVFTASSDWKYVALLAKRDSGLPKLYLIDTTNNDKLTTIDEGNASFSIVGWYNDNLIYEVTRNGVQPWQPDAQALKTYNAQTGQLKTIDQTTAEKKNDTADYDGYAFGPIYILNNEVVYAKDWYAQGGGVNAGSYNASALMSVKPDGTGLRTVQKFPIPAYGYSGYDIYMALAGPDELYLQLSVTDYPAPTPTYYEYGNSQLQKLPNNQATQAAFDKGYPAYTFSPSGNQTFWTEPRDGKNTLFVGDSDAQNSQQIATLSDYEAYGWYTDNYLLVSKNSSELYVMPRDGGKALKVTDYFNPNDVLGVYGHGYGGR